MYVDIGSYVRRSQILAVIDSTELFQQYEQALATFNNNKINFKHTKQLFQQRFLFCVGASGGSPWTVLHYKYADAAEII